MPGKPDKQHRIRVKTLDGKPRDQSAINKLKSNQLGMPHLDIVGTNVPDEFIICASKEAHIEQVRAKIGGAGLEAIDGGDTSVAPCDTTQSMSSSTRHSRRDGRRGGDRRGGRGGFDGGGPAGLGERGSGGGGSLTPETDKADFKKKPYGFVSLPAQPTTANLVWHDGTTGEGRLSGEVRFELAALTPLLVGWERGCKSTRKIGTVTSFKDDKGYGFISPESGGVDVFVHHSALETDGHQSLSKGQRVIFDVQQGQKGPHAVHVRVIDSAVIDKEASESDWPVPASLPNVGQLNDKKSVLCPLRAPWGKRPVIIPGDSLKGLLRHELGALLGAPMERVAERSYSYRPNQKFPYDQRDHRYRPGTALLEPRLARVRTSTTAEIGGRAWPVPEQVDVLSMAMRDQQAYFPRREGRGRDAVTIRPTCEAEPYRGGLGGGQALPDQILAEDARRKMIHTHVDVTQLRVEHEAVSPSAPVIAQYSATLRHLLDVNEGHFSARHPHIGTDQQKQRMGREAVEGGAAGAFQPGDLVWVEWDTENKCIVSLGWHYYYRWAYTDSVRKTGGELERRGLFPLGAEHDLVEADDEKHRAPQGLSAVRRLFGYTGDNEGSAGIGVGDHAQLMGRVFVNAGLEVVGDNDADDERFLEPVFLKELGMPRPSAVEHYIKQPHHPRSRPSDKATLVTYGDAAGYDAPGELAGRKFYLDRKDAYTGTPWKDASDTNRQNERSTLALEASKAGRKFRFTVRFRDLDASELAAILVALSPDQFKGVLGGIHTDGYCSKLGYARPLGWGSVRIKAEQLLWLDEAGGTPALTPEADIAAWVTNHYQETVTQDEWLAIHRRNHPNAADYPRRNGEIYTHHTTLRAEHSRARRYRSGGKP